MRIEDILNKKKKNHLTIEGNRCNPEQRVGYCWFSEHPGYLTKALLEEHNCIEKNCRHFQKYQDATYWKLKTKSKIKRNESKLQKRKLKEQKEKILNIILEETKSLEDFAVIEIKKENNVFVISYVTLNWIPIQKISDAIRSKITEKILMREIKTSYEKKIALLEKYKIDT